MYIHPVLVIIQYSASDCQNICFFNQISDQIHYHKNAPYIGFDVFLKVK